MFRIFFCLLIGTSVGLAYAEERRTLVDEFDGQFDLDWTVIRDQPDEYSLETHPGELLVKTLPGSINARNQHYSDGPAPNIFLLTEPLGDEGDFEAILHVNEFQPTRSWQQIAMLVYQTDDDYLKWSMEQASNNGDRIQLVRIREVDEQTDYSERTAMEIDGPFWLKITRRGDEYEFFHSDDGDVFQSYDSIFWVAPSEELPLRIGFVGKNGAGQPNKADVLLESFTLHRGSVE